VVFVCFALSFFSFYKERFGFIFVCHSLWISVSLLLLWLLHLVHVLLSPLLHLVTCTTITILASGTCSTVTIVAFGNLYYCYHWGIWYMFCCHHCCIWYMCYYSTQLAITIVAFGNIPMLLRAWYFEQTLFRFVTLVDAVGSSSLMVVFFSPPFLFSVWVPLSVIWPLFWFVLPHPCKK